MKIRRKHPVRVNHLGSDPIPQLVRRLALPAMLAQFVNVLYSIIDRMYIGNIANVGDIALAGVGICGPIVTMISAFAAWIGNGGAPLLSIKSGEQNKEGASVILANCFVLLIGMAVCLTIGAYLCKDALLVWFGATERIFPYAETYMRIYLIGTVFAVLSLGLNQFIICQGFSNLGMVSVIIGAILNILLDPLFIFALHMGVRGAAVATVLSQAASCAFSLYILFRGPVPVKITFHGYSFSVCSDVLTLGLTPFLIILFDNVLIIVQNVMLKNYGDTARIRLAEKHILKTALLFCTIMFVFAQWDVSAGIFVGLFTQNAAYRSMTVHFIHIYTLSVIPLAVQYALVDGLTGMSLVGASLPLSFFRKGIYIALAVFLPIRFGAPAMFYAEPLSDVAAAAVTTIVFVTVVPGLLRKREALLGKHIEK